jgi:hypothetical protein
MSQGAALAIYRVTTAVKKTTEAITWPLGPAEQEAKHEGLGQHCRGNYECMRAIYTT